MARGYVYIFTNPCLDGWVKIGMTERNDIAERLRDMNAPSNIPLSFRCYAVYETSDPVMVEGRIHSLIDRIDYTLRAREQLDHGRTRTREFFRMSPETAYGILYDVADLRGETENLTIYEPTREQAEEESLAQSRSRRANSSFRLLGIPVGETVYFLFDETITAEVADDNNSLLYEGEPYSVSSLAHKLLVEKKGWRESTPANGWRYFMYNGTVLNDLRELTENQAAHSI